MSMARAMWIHGHGVRIEHPDRLVSEWRAGFFVRLVGRPESRLWVHYGIPTPVLVGPDRLKAGSVMVRFRSVQADDAWVAAVHIYDGETRIAAHDGLNHRSADWIWPRFEVPGHPEVRWGVGVSIQLAFGIRQLSDRQSRVIREGAGVSVGGQRVRVPTDSILGGAGRAGGSGASGGGGSPGPSGPQLRHAIEISAVGCDFLR